MDNKEYLEEGFDPKSLKVSQLRGILNEYQISFPSNAKKSDLIKLFDDQLKPKAAQLLKNYRASVGNSNNSGFVDVAKSSNLSKKMSNEITKVSDEKRKVSKSKRKTRKSSTPIEELEVVDITEESPFSNDNVFQKKSPSSKKRNHEEATEKDSHKKQKGNIFGVESDSDDDLFKDSKKSRVSNAKSDTPIVVKESDNSTKSTPVKTDKSVTSTPAKADKSVTDSVKSPASNSSTKSVRSPASEEVHIPRRKIITPEAEPPKKTSLEDELPKETSLEDEAKDFDSDLNKIKSASTTPKTRNLRKRTPQSTPSSSKATPKTRRQINQDLADQLGITIKGYSPKYKSLTPKPRGTITRKPIIQPIESDDEEVETESDDEENTKRNQVKNKVKSIENLPFKLIFRTITYLILWVSLISIGLFGYWYREQQYLVGYCGHEITQPTIPQTIDTSPILLQIGNYLDENFKPKCIKCPAHARCFENLQIGCYEDFVEYKPWYFDYLPILNRTTKICIPDTKKAEKIEIMIDVALDFLRSKNADKNCGRSLPSDLEAGLEVNELHDLLLSMKAPYITTEEFEELWQRSLIELEKEPEIITGYTIDNIQTTNNTNHTRNEEEGENKILRSTSLSHISLQCRFSNTIIGSMIEYKEIFIGLILISIIIFSIKTKYERYQLKKEKIETLYRETLQKLQKQRKLSKSSTELPGYISSIQLRDLILSNESNLKNKLEIWKKIISKIELNTNVKSETIEHFGEVMKVWEWIGESDN